MRKTIIFLLLTILINCSFFAQTAPDFTITTTHNETVSLYADYLDNGKTVVLDIFFVACAACNALAPQLETAYQEWGAGEGDVEFISLSNQSWDNNIDVLGFEELHGLSFAGAGSDGGGKAATMPYIEGTFGPFQGTPTLVVIAPDGTVNFDIRGSSQANTIALLNEAISETGAMQTQLTVSLGGLIFTELNEEVGQVTLDINNIFIDPTNTQNDGSYQFPAIFTGTNVEITPFKAINPRNGVSTFDLVLMQKHILGIQPFDSPYKLIAADVNESGGISVSDLLDMQKIILQIYTEFPNTTSWRFVDAFYTFSDPQNPLVEDFPTSISVNNINQNITAANFVGIKMGDVNNTVSPDSVQLIENRYEGTYSILLENQYLSKGETTTIDFKRSQFNTLDGFQFSLSLDPASAELLEINTYHPNFLYHISENGLINCSWFDATSYKTLSDDLLFSIQLKAKKGGNIRNYFSINDTNISAEAYTKNNQLLRPILDVISPQIKPVFCHINAFPNPTSKSIYIEYFLIADGIIALDITDTNGRIVHSLSASYHKKGTYIKNVNVDHLPNGLYTIFLHSNKKESETATFFIK